MKLDRVIQATYFDKNSPIAWGGDYYLQLSDVACEKDAYGYYTPSEKGTLLLLDLWGEAASPGGILLPEGTYTFDPSKEPMTLNPYNTGILVSDGIKTSLIDFESGDVDVALDGNTYTVTANLVDHDQVRYRYEFRGTIDFAEYVPPVYDPIESDVETRFIGADGLYYGDRDANGLAFFEIYLYDVPLEDGFLSGAGNMLIVQMLAPIEEVDGEFHIPDGIYSLAGSSGGAWRFVPGYLPEGSYYPEGSV